MPHKAHSDYLSRREQLMNDIDCIVDCFDRETESDDDLIIRLQDAVIKNFPTNS